jgi:hypothetical protein
MHCFDYATNFLLSHQPMVDQDTPNHKHAVLGLHLATQLTQECPSTSPHVPRCQLVANVRCSQAPAAAIP